MENLTVAKFGGSALGEDGRGIPRILERIRVLREEGRVVAVFSAPLTSHAGTVRSITDVVIEAGAAASRGEETPLDTVLSAYHKIRDYAGEERKKECEDIIGDYIAIAQDALDAARRTGTFADETRSRALGYAGELLISQIMRIIIKNAGMSAAAPTINEWPIITDENIEFTNFVYSESVAAAGSLFSMIYGHDVVSVGGFVGRTAKGTITTYERGGSDRTAADIGILCEKRFNVHIDFEKDNAVASADPKIVRENIQDIAYLSYNEARLAGMFGMKILDPIAIKEILENGAEIPMRITKMSNPEITTGIGRGSERHDGHPIKLVTGKKNCTVLRMERDAAQRMLAALERERRYSEFVILSPYTMDGTEFTRVLFLDADYVRRNEKYILGFDPLASITGNRGVITLIGDEMWRAQHMAARSSSMIGDAGLNILNMDAQEETSRIIFVVEDVQDNVADAVRAIHAGIPQITFR